MNERAFCPALCRDCAAPARSTSTVCQACGGRRVLHHDELPSLTIAHIDCDAFFASVEKRDNPALADRPVIVGGGRRGVVAACCYVARLYGVRSAMPMFKALKACPDAVVIRPDHRKYSLVGQQIRERFLALTPLVEPLSIDEAFLDLSGTERLHGRSPAGSLARLAVEIERDLGVTVSIGLSYNKFLAKLASERDKPRGYAVIGRAEAPALLAALPIGSVSGIGERTAARLAAQGVNRLGDVLKLDEASLFRLLGSQAARLRALALGQDERPVTPGRAAKSISAETTFDEDIREPAQLVRRLWPLAEQVSGRLRKADLAAAGITVKLKTAEFQTLTRTHRLSAPTQLAEILWRHGGEVVQAVAHGRAFRLIGIGAAPLCAADLADQGDMLDRERPRLARREQAINRIRDRLGAGAIVTGRSLPDR